ncbi:hypothetical protein A2335_01525 [Candidatus Peregrinibacteria bacterium RIFOXYB2_FULL_32_7]|nr:MAG: hypothetical protein A2335_01525 [Candidatus Peregrinibacteria bacterium RIFOXYB2_FULL_32_7]
MKSKEPPGSFFKDKTILIINAGSIKKRFIYQKIKKLELKIIVLNKKEEGFIKPYVDHWIIADTGNHNECVQAVKEFINTHPEIVISGVITFWEDDVLLTSKILDRFNFIGIPLSVAKKARNKFLFREFCEQNNIPAPKHAYVRSEEDIKKVIENFNFPLVIKPVFGSSSAYVMKIENEEELKNSYEYIKKSISTNVESALHDGFDLLVEEYIDGDEVDIDILIQNGRIKFCGISDNTKTKEPFFIETDRLTPSQLPEKDQDELLEMADFILEKIGVQNGCIHLEAKSTKKGPVPIEVNLRMGGDEIYSSVKAAWKVDLIENALKIALGIHVDKFKNLEEPRKYLIARTLLSDYSGVLMKLNIDEQLEKLDYVEDLAFFKKIGDSIFVPPDGYEYFGWLMVSGDNHLDAEENMNSAMKYINYEIARFHSASSIGKTSRKNGFSFSVLNKYPLVRQNVKIEKIRQMNIKDQRNLHIGIACNNFMEGAGEIEKTLNNVGLIIEKTLKKIGYNVTFFDFNKIPDVLNDLQKSNIDMIFNVCERINGSSLLEPHATAVFDILQIPYTGSNSFTLALCIDKIRVKKLLTYHHVPTPKWDYAYDMDDEISSDLIYPLIVKPSNTDDSIGVTNNSVVLNKKQLQLQMEKVIKGLNSPALVEEYIEGDEYDVSILGSEEDDLRVLPLSRSIYDNLPKGYWHIFPYEAKYGTGDLYKKNIIVQRPPKNISKKLEALISEIAMDTYNILGCHDYGRVDVKLDKNNNPYVLELNSNPSINIGNCVPAVAELTGMTYSDFLEEIISLAIKRYKNRSPYYHLQTKII